jgi:LacI family transcriptional regulator
MADRLTIRDVARLAGVSTATVSRVLNEKPDVDAATRARIQRIVDEQQFVPSLAGAGLARGRTGLIGVLLPSLTWPIMTPILSGIADVFEQTSHELVLYGHSHKRERGETIQRIMDARLIDGLIAVFPDGAAFPGDVANGDGRVSRCLTQLAQRGFPVVVIDDQRVHDDVPWICADNRMGAMEAVRHLLSLGHVRIAHIIGPLVHLCAQERLAGYRAALAEARVPIDPELELPCDFTARGGQAAADRLFSMSEPPTAVFAASDDMAYGVLTAARCHGFRVPEDVALVGFDDAGPSAFTKPPLTTVRQPFFDMGRQAATTLTALLAERRSPPDGGLRWYRTDTPGSLIITTTPPAARSRLQLPVQLIERASTMAPKCLQKAVGESMP